MGTNLSDIAAIILTGLTMVVTVYIIYITSVSQTKINALEGKVEELGARISKSHLMSEEVERVTLDLHSKIQLIYSMLFYYKETGEFSDIIIDRIREMKMLSDKHMFELSLLSSNRSKRVSALHALSKGAGDVESLKVISQLIELSKGQVLDELKEHHDILYERLVGHKIYDASLWTGRPNH